MLIKNILHLIIVLGVSLSSISIANGQIFNEKFGVYGGINVSNFYGDEDIGETDARSAYVFGTYYKYELDRRMFLIPRLQFISKGGHYNYENDNPGGEALIQLHYMELPVLLAFENRRRVGFHIGPYLGLLLAASAEDHRHAASVSASSFTNFELGGMLGVSGRVNRFFLGLDIAGGLTEIGKSKLIDEEEVNFVGSAKNLGLMFTVGFFF